jgi:uncharacterized membrane protein
LAIASPQEYLSLGRMPSWVNCILSLGRRSLPLNVSGSIVNEDFSVSGNVERAHEPAIFQIQPFHAVLLSGTVPLFLGATLSDIVYAATYEIQWTNFASWLIVSGLVFGGIALLFAVIDLFRAERRDWRSPGYALLLLATWGWRANRRHILSRYARSRNETSSVKIVVGNDLTAVLI